MAKRYSTKQFVRALRDLAKVPSRVSSAYAEELRQQLDQQFATGQDPYGRAWAPLKPATLRQGRHPPPLTDSGHMSRNITALPMSGAGVRLVSTVDYSVYHQEGTTHMAARPFFPTNVLPSKWRQILDRLLQAELDKTIG